MHLAELKSRSDEELADLAAELGVATGGVGRDALVSRVLRAWGKKRGDIRSEGVLEVLADGFGFLRAPDSNYLPGPDDIYVSPSQIRRFNLRTGDTVSGVVRPPKESERYYALLRVETINGLQSETGSKGKTAFDHLTAVHPRSPLTLDGDGATANTRAIGLIAPIGKGQRCLLVAPPRAGKTAALRDLAAAISKDNEDTTVLVLLIDERPEEVTEISRALPCEVVASTFEEPPARHVQVAEIVLERAKRMAETGTDVVVLIDSLTRLIHSYNAVVPSSGKPMPGGVDVAALHKPRRFFGAARNFEDAGSLTIVATMQVETATDDALFEEFRSSANSTVFLSSEVAMRRMSPTVDVVRSVTHKDELLVGAEDLPGFGALRARLSQLPPLEAAAALRELFSSHADNRAVLSSEAGS